VKSTFRPWTTGDAAIIHDILRETWLDAYARYVPAKDLLGYLEQNHSPELIEKSVEDGDVAGFIAEVDGSAAGCIRTQLNKKEARLYVQQLYILPKYQGLGLGKKLMELAAERARSLGFDRVWLGVMEQNESALLWYKNMGYEIAETAPFSMGSTVVNHHIGFVPLDRIFSARGQTEEDRHKALLDKALAVFDSRISSGSLPQLCMELMKRQKSAWSQLKDAYAALESGMVREIDCGGFSVRLQYNPGRIASTSAAVDPDSLRSRTCFLCLEHLPGQQKGILYRNKFIVLCNPAPIFDPHFTVSHVSHIPQDFTSAAGILLDLARDMSPDFTVFYNGPKCGASAPDHLHFQAAPRGRIPVEVDAVDVVRRRKLYYESHVAASLLMNCGRSALIIESTDKRRLAGFLNTLIDAGKSKFGVSEEPMMNVLCSYQQELWRLIIFFRRKHRPDVYFKTGTERVLVSPAAVDLGGLIITPLENDFLRIDANCVKSIFSEVCVEESAVEDLVKGMA
jgi:ribosomal protein S18 acetylase RimI-like enzyme